MDETPAKYVRPMAPCEALVIDKARLYVVSNFRLCFDTEY
jgi:hypothetical protein